jgi:MFS family permease
MGASLVKAQTAWVVAVCYGVGVAGTMDEFSVPPVTSVFQMHMRVPAVSADFLMSLFALATLLTALPAGTLVRRFGEKLPTMARLALYAAGALLVSRGYFDSNFPILLGAHFVSDVGFGLISVAAPAAISQEVAPENLPVAMGVWATWVSLVSVVMFVLAPRLISPISVLPMKILFVTADIVAVVALSFLPLKHVAEDAAADRHHSLPGQVWKPMI